MVKYLITGAAGFIGSHVVEYLLERGVKRENLRLLVMNGESLENLPNDNFDIITGDIRNRADVKKAVKDVDIVYHLAAVTRDGWLDYVDVNYTGTKILIEECKRQKIKKIVFFSTIAIYGLPAFVGNKEDITEETPLCIQGDYAKSKYLAEQVVRESGLSYAIIRPTTVYGPRDKAGIYQLYWALKRGYFFRIGNGKNKVDYVYVRDLVQGARAAELSPKNVEYILGSKRPIAFLDLVKIVAKVAGKSIPGWYVPRWLGLLMAYILLPLRLPLSPNRIRVMTANYYFGSKKAYKEICYNPKTGFEKGVRLTYEK